MYRFMLIPREGDAVNSVLTYKDSGECRLIGVQLAGAILGGHTRTQRPALRRIADTKPRNIELVVMNLQTGDMAYPPMLIER
jgi:hypothetical protein